MEAANSYVLDLVERGRLSVEEALEIIERIKSEKHYEVRLEVVRGEVDIEICVR